MDQWFPTLQQHVRRNSTLRDLRFHDDSTSMDIHSFLSSASDNQETTTSSFMPRVESLHIERPGHSCGNWNAFFQDIPTARDKLQHLCISGATGYKLAPVGIGLAKDASVDRLIELLASVVIFHGSGFDSQKSIALEACAFRFGVLRGDPGVWCHSVPSTTLKSSLLVASRKRKEAPLQGGGLCQISQIPMGT